MRHEFNQNLYGARLVPPTPSGLAERIIASAKSSALEDNFLMMIVLPRPFLIMSVLFVLSFFAGIGMDLGFNSTESVIVNEQDILYPVDEISAGEIL